LSIVNTEMSQETDAGKLRRIVSDSNARPSFALLTPYTGGNLGDGAIQDAVISNIRSRFPRAAIYGITLNPADTVKRHGILSYPISGFSLGEYTLVSPSPVGSTDADSSPSARMPSVLNRVRKALASAPIRIARFLLPRGWPWIVRCETTHLVNGFRFLRNVNFLIVSGGGQLDDFFGGPWGHPYALLKWTALARLRGARPIFFSVGFGTLDSRLSRLFTRIALSLAAYRSYRDTGSRDLVNRAGFRRDDPVFPDLAYSLPLDRSQHSQDHQRGGRVVGLSPFCYCHPRHWPRKDAAIYEVYLRNLTTIVQWLVAKEYRVSLVGSDSPDEFAIDDLWELLSTTMSSEQLAAVERHRVTNVQGFLEQAARVDVMVASRLHGVLMAQRVGTPVIALSYERKVDVQMKAVGHGAYRLSIENLRLSDFQECFETLQASPGIARQQIQTHFDDCRALLDDQYDTVLRPEERPDRRGGCNV
jgi:polysaccharide pyruvyl transferase WcaK-like protein